MSRVLPWSLLSGSLPSSLDRSSEIPDRYWFNPRSNSFVISPLAPSDDAELVLANIIPGEAPLDFGTVRLIYEQQKKDAYNQANQQNTCTTKEAREKKAVEYAKQTPNESLSDNHRNVEFRKNNDPNQGQSSRSGCSKKRLRLPYFVPIHTPDYFSYTTVIVVNSAYEGLLHLLIRHGHQLVSHGLSRDILSILPPQMKNIVDMLRSSNSRDLNGRFMNEMMQMSDDDYLKLLKLQDEAWKLIQRTNDYMGERINVNGQQQVYWRLNSQWTLVTATSCQLYSGLPEMGEWKKRPIRKIITVFPNEMSDYEKKKRDGWPVTMSQKKPWF